MMKGIKRLVKLAIIAGVIYIVYQKVKGRAGGYVPAATPTDQDMGVKSTDAGYEIDETKLGGTVSQDLLDILVCPDDKQALEYVDGKWLVCHTCGRQYPIVDGIPVMLIEVGDKYRNGTAATAGESAG
jgi:uncharacterized protein YbaR (Trm112 family)